MSCRCVLPRAPHDVTRDLRHEKKAPDGRRGVGGGGILQRGAVDWKGGRRGSRCRGYKGQVLGAQRAGRAGLAGWLGGSSAGAAPQGIAGKLLIIKYPCRTSAPRQQLTGSDGDPGGGNGGGAPGAAARLKYSAGGPLNLAAVFLPVPRGSSPCAAPGSSPCLFAVLVHRGHRGAALAPSRACLAAAPHPLLMGAIAVRSVPFSGFQGAWLRRCRCAPKAPGARERWR